MLNKKAQVGETVTWMVATVIIVFILVFFLFGASMLAQTKDIKMYRKSLFSSSSYQGDDLFLKKNLFTYYTVQKDFFRRSIDMYLAEKEANGDFKFSLNETRKVMIKNLQ